MVGIPTIGLFFYNHGVGEPMGGGFFRWGCAAPRGGSSASPKRIEVVSRHVVRVGLRGVMRRWRMPG